MAYTQPTTFNPKFETTDASTTTRPMSGVLKGAPLFVVEAYEYTVENVKANEGAEILQAILRRPSKPTFQLYYFSPFYGAWRTDTFYVTQPTIEYKSLAEGKEEIKSISCNMIGVNPL